MNRIVILGVITVLLFSSCGSTKNTKSNDLAIKSPIKAQLDLTKVKEDKLPVIINPGRFTKDKVIYRLPRVVQGTYSVSDFGRYIDNLKAIDYNGNDLPVVKVDTNTWEISKATQLDKIIYLVNDTFDQELQGGIGKKVPFSPAGTNIEPTNYVLNLHGVIGYFDSLKNNQYKLEVVSPLNYKRTSALQEVASETNSDSNTITSSYFAPRYFDITDNPMFFGELDVEEFQVGDIKIVLSVYSPNKTHSAKKIKEVVQRMMQAQKTYLGSINSTARYDIYLYLSDGTEKAPKGFGALEHHTSTVVVLPEAMPDQALAKSMIDVVSHEFFHIVTPLSVHSEDVHYFDYNQPTFSKHLWMYEGVTEYFATLFQINQGLVKEDEFYSKILGKIRAASSMDDTMSFTKMSENILEEPYASQYLNVYQKGALIGMCIDIILREESNGARGILSLMKELALKYGKSKPFNDEKLIEEITKMTYPSIGIFLNTHVVGNTPIDYSKFFSKVGLQEREIKEKTNYIENNGQIIFNPDKVTQTVKFTNAVKNNSFWTENGVLPDDVIKEVDGIKVAKETAREVFMKMYMWKPGTDVEVKLDRKGKEILIKTTLTQSYTKVSGLEVNSKASIQEKQLKEAWLKG
ncbi:M61 family metallopeptidase [Tenacibaculum sp. C7A-26P2]|uniref:M61 family metallopeptidase n=1 Tax=Tenacibaculum sp. C7A-26P2 TaxID=3447504 RepID=UPI003F87A042